MVLQAALSLGFLIQGVTVSNEFPVDTPIFRAGQAEKPAVAFDGTNYLVVWSDERNDFRGDVYGVRVDANGTPLGPNFYISPAGRNPDVAFDGTNFLVVSHTPTGFPEQDDVYGVRVSPAGEVLDPTPIHIGRSSTADELPAVAGGTGGWLVVWSNGLGTNANVVGARVSSAGVLQDTTPITISGAAAAQTSPDVAFDGTRFMVVWRDFRATNPAIYGARVSTAGALQDPNGVLLAGGSTARDAPAIAFDGTRFLVVFATGPVGARNIDAVRVSTAAALVGSVFTISLHGADEASPAVTWTGTNYVVGWHRESPFDAWAARVDAAGTVLDTTAITVANQASGEVDVALASNGSNALVVWRDSQVGVASRRLSAAGVILDATRVVLLQVPNLESALQAAWDGANAFVVWSDDRNGNQDIYGARVTPAGASLDGTGIAIATNAANEATPAVAFGSANYLVVWQRGGDIFGRLFTTAGVAVGAEFTVTSAATAESVPRLAFDGTNFLVVFRSSSNIAGARVSEAGAVLDATPIAIATTANDEDAPDVAFDGTQFKVFYDQYFSTANRHDVWCRIVSTAGVPAGTSGVAFRGGSGTTSYGNPRVSMGPAGQLVAMISGNRVVVLPVGSGCTPPVTAGSITIGAATSASSIASDGTHFLVAWNDTEGVKASMVTAAPWPSHPDGLSVTPPSLSSSRAPAVVGTGTGSYLVVYEKSEPGQTLGGRGQFRTLALTYAANGMACGDGTSCSTGYCIDGVCCDTSCGGDNTADCQACSTAAGAAVNGTCGILPATHVCAPSTGPCDVADRCSGTSTFCDRELAPAGTVCRASAGVCDVEELCDGVDAGCPADGFAPVSTVCRASAGACDLEETCTGSDAQCPNDTLASPTMSCRASVGECDVVEVCTGAATMCPMDGFANDGTACSVGTCQAGVCVSVDAGVPDAGLPDAGPADAGETDAGVPDAGAVDSGVPAPDAGTSDAGVMQMADAGVSPDGGLEPTTPGGCGCSAGAAPWDLSLLALAVVGVLRAARRRVTA